MACGVTAGANLLLLHSNRDKVQQEELRITTIGPSATIVLYYEPIALTIDIGFCKPYRSLEALARILGFVGKILLVADRFPLKRDQPQILFDWDYTGRAGLATKRANIDFSRQLRWYCKCFVSFFYFVSMFRLRHVPSLHAMLSLIFKTTCVVLLETVVTFLWAYTLKGIIMETYTTTNTTVTFASKVS